MIETITIAESELDIKLLRYSLSVSNTSQHAQRGFSRIVVRCTAAYLIHIVRY